MAKSPSDDVKPTSNPNKPDVSIERELQIRHGMAVAAMSLLILVLSYMILSELTSILRPLMVAVFVGYLILPAHRWLVDHRIPSKLSYVVIVGTFLTVMYIVGSMTYQSVSDMSQKLPTYVQQLDKIAHDKMEEWKAKLSALVEDDDEGAAETQPASRAAEEDPADILRKFEASLPTEKTEPGDPATTRDAAPPKQSLGLISIEQLTSLGQSAVNTFLGVFTNVLVIVVYLIFLMAEQAGFPRRLELAFGVERAKNVMNVIGTINKAISRYIAVKTFVSLLVGGLSFVVLLAFGVPYAFLWGVITFFANFIPYIGSLAAMILPIGMSFVEFGFTNTPIIIAILLTTAQLLTGNLLEPKLVGQQLGVSPVMILLSLAFWGYLWGIPGMILSAPLAVTIKIVLENIEQTKPVARLFSDE